MSRDFLAVVEVRHEGSRGSRGEGVSFCLRAGFLSSFCSAIKLRRSGCGSGGGSARRKAAEAEVRCEGFFCFV